MFDPELYRPKSEVEEWKKRDPIPLLISSMRREGLIDDREIERIESSVAAEVDDAVAFAEAGSLEPPKELTRFVYSDRRSE